MTLKCDVQYKKGETGFKLTKVGVKGVRKPILVRRDGVNGALNGALNCTIDLSVDLPAAQKGSHLSRNVEVLTAVLEESLSRPVSGLENVAADICGKLLEHHEYALTADVDIRADYFKQSRTPFGRETLEAYVLRGAGRVARGSPVRKSIGVDAIGMTACPCAQQTVREMLSCAADPPVMSHNQRNVCRLTLSMDESVDVEADDLIDLVERSFSSPTYELLKRDDEGKVVINAHSNPKFVEDVVRHVLKSLASECPGLPDDVEVRVESESEESIHKHNAFAERTATMGEIRREAGSG
ncbi:MAG: GTP cyclohydrolase MptA [Candidatus Methanoplasma sp.]|jgi:GTP cyclohydrolase-4|nr:GTP cyclohydrolase MptA [Candidatus Methanoplasma sp.]